MTTHWAEQYLACTWQADGLGPDAWHCFAFTKHVLQTHYDTPTPEWGWELPRTLAAQRALIQKESNSGRWLPAQLPSDGSVFLAARSRVPVHIGMCVKTHNGLRHLHCAEPVGVLCQDVNGMRAAGWGRIQYYTRVPV